MNHVYSNFIVHCYTPKAFYNHIGGLSSTTSIKALEVLHIHIYLIHIRFIHWTVVATK